LAGCTGKAGSWIALDLLKAIERPIRLQLDPLAPEHLHVQVVRAGAGERTGVGVLEQICLGPYEPSGFAGLFDGAKR